MTFNTPNVSDILNTLIGNDALISVLKENGALITREKLLNEYHKSVMAKTVREANLRNLEMMQDIAELILANEEHIRKESIWQLTVEEFLFKEIRSIFGLEKANDSLYQSIFYCYKYCYVSSFFQNNANRFIPECDIEEIRGNPAAEAFLDAMLKEFDKINRLLEETKDYLDYDKIPWDYIVYLTQLLGLEKDLLNFDDTEEEFYRELAKNILDIYRIKGTTYSYKLFFNFLGIDIEIKEFFFDRRYFYAKYPQENTDTGTSDKYSKDFYLTTINPSYNLNPSFSTSEIVTLNDFSKQENLRDFEELVTKYGLEAVLGYSKYDKNGEEYTERVFKYFKTNYIYYYASALGGRANLTSKQISSLAKYLDFLTPIFVMRDIKTVAYSMSDNDSIAFDGGDGDRKYGALIDGTYEGFQMLDGECWDTINKDLYLAVSDDGENRQFYYARNGKQIEYRNSLPEWNDVDTKTFRQPLEFSAMSIFTSRYLGYERYYSNKDELSFPNIPAGRRVKFYSYNDENGTIYKYSTPPKVDFDVSKTSLDPIKKPIEPKIWSTKGRDSVRNEIEKNNYFKEIKYVIDSKGNDVNNLLNSEDPSMSELLECSWKEDLLSYTTKSIKTSMLNQDVGGTLIGNTTIKYPSEYENNAEAILNAFNVVLFTGKHIENPKTEAELYLESIYVDPDQIKKHLVVGDYYVKRESGKYNIYRCCYENKKVWFLSKLFPDYKTENGVVVKDKNNEIQLSGNFKTERNFSNALKSFFAVCKMSGANIDRYSHLYKIGGARGYYYAPTQIYTEVFGEDSARPAGLVPLESGSQRGYFDGDISLVGKTFFSGTSISYDNNIVEEEAVKNNMRYICFWDRQIGDLIYDEYDGKIYEVYNYGPKGLVEVKFNGSVKKEKINGKEHYRLFEFDKFWKGYDEEADSDDFIAYNNEHIINWSELGIYKCKWHRPVKFFTDKLYDNENDFRNNFDKKLFYIDDIKDLQGEKPFKKMLLRDIWNKSYESFSEDLKFEFIKRIIDVSYESDDNPETEKIKEGYNTEELFTRFYGLITREKDGKQSSYTNLINLIKDSVENEHYDLTSTAIDNEVLVKELFANEWLGFGDHKFDKYYNFATDEWEKASVALERIENGAYKDYRTVDINNNVGARACFEFNASRIKDDYGEYTSPNYLMLDLLNNCLNGKEDDFLKDYFYEELLKRYREAFISDDNGMKIDSNDYGLFQGMPTTVEKWNGKGGKFAAPKVLNSQFLNEGSDNYSSIKIPLKSIEFKKNDTITIPVNDRSNNNKVVEKPSTDIIFTFGFGDWYYNVREIFGINSIRDFSGRLIYGESADDAIAELRENYIKCFSPIISFPEDYSSLKYFKNEIEVDYNNDYRYAIYYINNSGKKIEISSIEQGVVSIYYNGSWVDWEAENNAAEKRRKLKDVFNKSIIEIIVNNTSRNPYLTKKRFAKTNINRNLNVLSECPEFMLDTSNPDSILLKRETYGNVGYISLKYLRHKFRDNYVSVPNGLDWIKIKNGKKDEYTSYGDDREVASKTTDSSIFDENDNISNGRLENKIKLLNEGGVLNIEDGSIVEDYDEDKFKKQGLIIQRTENGNVDITNKAKYIKKKNDVFADKIIDKNGDIVLKIKGFSISDIKEVLFSFRLLFVKITSKVIRINAPLTYKVLSIKRDVKNLLSYIKYPVFAAKSFIKRDAVFNSIDNFVEYAETIFYREGTYNIGLTNNIINTFKYHMYGTLRHTYLVRICNYNKNIAKTYFGRLFRSILINIKNSISDKYIYFGRLFKDITIEVDDITDCIRHIGRLFRSILININQASSELFIFKGVQTDLDNTERIIINIYFKDIPQWVKYARVFWTDTVNNNNVVYTGVGVGIRNSSILRKTIFNIIKATGDIEGFEIIKNLKKTRFIANDQDSIQNSVTIAEGTIVDYEETEVGGVISTQIKDIRNFI